MNRPRRLTISVRGLILAVVVIGLAMRFAVRFVPLTPNEAIRVARAEIARRDPEFLQNAKVFDYCPNEVNVGHLWNWAYQWQVLFKRNDSDAGCFVEIHDREDIRVGRAWRIKADSWSYDEPL